MQQCAWTGYLLDDLVGRRKHGRRQCEAERNGSLEIDNELELSGLYHWKVSRFFPVKDASGVDAGRLSRTNQLAWPSAAVACRPAFSRPVDGRRIATIAHKRMGTARNAPTGPHIQVQIAMERKTRNGLIVSR